jgi:predicted enzyme related to lactoylglutathione lyase
MAGTILGARPVLGSRDLAKSRLFWTQTLPFEVHVERDGYVLLRSGDAEIALQAADGASKPSEVLLRVAGVEGLHARCIAAKVPIASELHTHDSGRRDFTVLDPDQHRITLAEGPRQAGRIGWVDLTVEDATESRDFWAAVAGFDGVEPVPMGGFSDFVLTSDGRGVAGVCHARGVNAAMPPLWLVYFVVDDLDEALAEVERRGGQVLEKRASMAVVRDPAGAVAALWVGSGP